MRARSAAAAAMGGNAAGSAQAQYPPASQVAAFGQLGGELLRGYRSSSSTAAAGTSGSSGTNVTTTVSVAVRLGLGEV